jgi:hypothetical protein
MRSTFRLSAFALTTILLAGVAAADDVGDVGTIVGLQVNTASSDAYLQMHGRMYVLDGNKQVDEYRWGGTSCGSKQLTEAQVAALHRALDNKRMKIEPLSQTGQGQAVCLVGFTLIPKPALKYVAP